MDRGEWPSLKESTPCHGLRVRRLEVRGQRLEVNPLELVEDCDVRGGMLLQSPRDSHGWGTKGEKSLYSPVIAFYAPM